MSIIITIPEPDENTYGDLEPGELFRLDGRDGVFMKGDEIEPESGYYWSIRIARTDGSGTVGYMFQYSDDLRVIRLGRPEFTERPA